MNIASIKYASLVTPLLLAVFACSPLESTQKNRSSSDLNYVTIKAPKFPGLSSEQATAMNGHRLNITPIDCSSQKPFNQVGQSNGGQLYNSVQSGCDYYVGFELGKLSADSKTLEESYYSNFQANGQGGYRIKKSDFNSSKKLSIALTLTLTDLGTQKGFPANPILDSSTPDNPNTTPGPENIIGYDYRMEWQLSDLAAKPYQCDPSKSQTYCDVLNHTTQRYLQGNDLVTIAHETNHGINNDLQNSTMSAKYGVYVGEGKALMFTPEKTVNTGHAAKLTPPSMRTSFRYGTYMTQTSRDWMNLFDEWNSYMIGTRTGNELAASKSLGMGGRIYTDGSAEFIIFSTAVVMAIKQNNPQYFDPNTETGKQLRAIYAFMAEESMKQIRIAQTLIQSFDQVTLKSLDLLKKGKEPEAENMRQFLKEWLGSDFTERVFEF